MVIETMIKELKKSILEILEKEGEVITTETPGYFSPRYGKKPVNVIPMREQERRRRRRRDGSCLQESP